LTIVAAGVNVTVTGVGFDDVLPTTLLVGFDDVFAALLMEVVLPTLLMEVTDEEVTATDDV
jgi:hypothetical protein